MKSKTVLILDDDPALRETLNDGLRKRGFTVIAAASAREAHEKLADVPDLDVAILDIRLGDGPIPTGLDFGLQLKKERSEDPPAFLILSAYETPNYYQTALTLEAAAYLTKGTLESSADGGDPPKRADIVARHVRALALRRALKSERTGMAQHVSTIAEESASADEAVERFCGEVISRELESTLGPDYVLLLTAGGKTIAFSGRALPSSSDAVFARLQSAVFARLGETEPFVINIDEALSVSHEEREATQRVLRSFDDAAFIALGEEKSYRLSLGLLPGNKASDVKAQLKLIDGYLQKRVIGNLIEITRLWSNLEQVRQQRELLLDATSKFCLYQGHEIETALWEAQRNASDAQGLVPTNKLRTIAIEMREAGEVLASIATTSGRDESIDMKQLVERIWQEEVSPGLRLTGPDVFRVVGQCRASDDPERAERAVSQILGWMGRRLIRARQGEAVGLTVACHALHGRNRVQVIFEEHVSRRLPTEVRKSLFEPFNASFMSETADDKVDGRRRLGLYLAQTLAEKAGGALTDCSDKLDSPRVGHRFVLELNAGGAVA